MKLNWEKNYKKGNKDVVDSYSLSQPFNMSIHHHIYYDKDEWLFTCRDLDIMQKQLFTRDPEEAERKSLEIIKNHINDLQNKYNELVGK